jgi:hypothetical protein
MYAHVESFQLPATCFSPAPDVNVSFLQDALPASASPQL